MDSADSMLIFSDSAVSALDDLVGSLDLSGVFVLADSNTASAVARPVMDAVPALAGAMLIVIPAGDNNKSLDSLAYIWRRLSEGGATRHSLLVNIGGGMITDIGGFAAATFKRGIRFVNVPTSLLGAVDASVGGKTGINFAGLKNEVGAFAEAKAVIVDAAVFRTLPHDQIVSGYAELLKHALLESPEALSETLAFDLDEIDFTRLQSLLRGSIGVKQRVVASDPLEIGVRKSLNLGHTPAHAFEALAMERNDMLSHGNAVAWGLVTDLVLSNLRLQFPANLLRHVAEFVDRYYPKPAITCADYPRLIELMRHDKKNRSAEHINFTLLRSPGKVEIDCKVPTEEIYTALDIMRDLLHI